MKSSEMLSEAEFCCHFNMNVDGTASDFFQNKVNVLALLNSICEVIFLSEGFECTAENCHYSQKSGC